MGTQPADKIEYPHPTSLILGTNPILPAGEILYPYPHNMYAGSATAPVVVVAVILQIHGRSCGGGIIASDSFLAPKRLHAQ